MAIRLSGLSSGMDTEAIIKELMSAHSMKQTKTENSLTKLEWKEEIWEDLNTKISKFETGSLSKLKAQSSYLTKSVAASDNSCATFSAKYNVPTGTHTVEIKSVASSQFVTGKKLTESMIGMNPAEVTNSTNLVSLGVLSGTEFKLTKGTANVDGTHEEYTLKVTGSTTISDVKKWCDQYDVNFAFDNGRFFLSSKESGIDNSFDLTCDYNQAEDEASISSMLAGYTGTAEEPDTIENLMTELRSSDIAVFEAARTKATTYVKNVAGAKFDQFWSDYEAASTEEDKETVINQYCEDTDMDKSFLQEKLAAYNNDISTPEDKEAIKKSVKMVAEEDAYSSMYSVATSYHGHINESMNALEKLGIGTLSFNGTKMTSSLNTPGNTDVSIIDSNNCKILYNNAEFESSSNTQTINGMTITAVHKTQDGSPITISITNNTQAVYDTIKTFVKDYNELLKTMNTYYNAESARGYDVLSEEQKKEMSDEQVEKWEKKIKDSLLRRDSNLSSLISTMQSVLSTGVELDDGKTYSIISLGINTTDYSEKGLLHISGDSDDSSVQDQDKKLMDMLNEDPEKVMKILTGIGNEVYKSLSEQRKSTKLRSAMKYYDDKEITSQKKEYKTKISDWKTKLKDIEDRYYKKFAVMEKAMSQLNSQTNYISSLFSTGN